MRDKQGRTYIKLTELREGGYVVCDGDFPCIPAWSRKKVFRNDAGFFVECETRVRHYLEPQLQPDGSLIGVYPDGTRTGL
jgi:hypothetical protein